MGWVRDDGVNLGMSSDDGGDKRDSWTRSLPFFDVAIHHLLNSFLQFGENMT